MSQIKLILRSLSLCKSYDIHLTGCPPQRINVFTQNITVCYSVEVVKVIFSCVPDGGHNRLQFVQHLRTVRIQSHSRADSKLLCASQQTEGDHSTESSRKPCSCSKSNCLKLYCECTGHHITECKLFIV